MFFRKTIISSSIQVATNIAHVIFGLSIAYYFGASEEMDAYVAASNFIIALNALFVHSQGNTLIPFISKYKSHPEHKKIVSSIIQTNVAIFSCCSLLIFFGAKWIVFILAPGLPDQTSVIWMAWLDPEMDS